MVIIKNLKLLVYLTLFISLVITSHFAIVQLFADCAHHHVFQVAHSEQNDNHSTDAPCSHHHHCQAVNHFIIPNILFESAYTTKQNYKLTFLKVLLADPFIEAPFQPPRHS